MSAPAGRRAVELPVLPRTDASADASADADVASSSTPRSPCSSPRGEGSSSSAGSTSSDAEMVMTLERASLRFADAEMERAYIALNFAPSRAHRRSFLASVWFEVLAQTVLALFLDVDLCHRGIAADARMLHAAVGAFVALAVLAAAVLSAVVARARRARPFVMLRYAHFAAGAVLLGVFAALLAAGGDTLSSGVRVNYLALSVYEHAMTYFFNSFTWYFFAIIDAFTVAAVLVGTAPLNLTLRQRTQLGAVCAVVGAFLVVIYRENEILRRTETVLLRRIALGRTQAAREEQLFGTILQEFLPDEIIARLLDRQQRASTTHAAWVISDAAAAASHHVHIAPGGGPIGSNDSVGSTGLPSNTSDGATACSTDSDAVSSPTATTAATTTPTTPQSPCDLFPCTSESPSTVPLAAAAAATPDFERTSTLLHGNHHHHSSSSSSSSSSNHKQGAPVHARSLSHSSTSSNSSNGGDGTNNNNGNDSAADVAHIRMNVATRPIVRREHGGARALPALLARTIAETYDDATVMFVELLHLDALTPAQTINLLSVVNTHSDEAAARYAAVLKTKTQAQSLMFTANVLRRARDACRQALSLALDIRGIVRDLAADYPQLRRLACRVGVATGTVVGVIGTARPKYDVWGDACNVAARVVAAAAPWAVVLHESCTPLLPARTRTHLQPLAIHAKGKGVLRCFAYAAPAGTALPTDSPRVPVPDSTQLIATLIAQNPVVATLHQQQRQQQRQQKHKRQQKQQQQKQRSNEMSSLGKSAAVSADEVMQAARSLHPPQMRWGTLLFKDPDMEEGFARHFAEVVLERRRVATKVFTSLVFILLACVCDYFHAVQSFNLQCAGFVFLPVFFWLFPLLYVVLSRTAASQSRLTAIFVGSWLSFNLYAVGLVIKGIYVGMSMTHLVYTTAVHVTLLAPFSVLAWVDALVLVLMVWPLVMYSPWLVFQTVLLVLSVIVYGLIASSVQEKNYRRSFGLQFVLQMQEISLAEKRELNKSLLRSIVPAPIARRLADAGRSGMVVDTYDDASVLVVDIVSFTTMCSQLHARDVVALLDRLFRECDGVCAFFRLEKIKTIGDAYIAVCNVNEPVAQHAEHTVAAGIEILARVAALNAARTATPAAATPELRVRVGVHTGSVLAGIVLTKSCNFDCWGDTVDVATALEECAAPGSLCLSAQTYARLSPQFCACYGICPAPKPLRYKDTAVAHYRVVAGASASGDPPGVLLPLSDSTETVQHDESPSSQSPDSSDSSSQSVSGSVLS